MADYGFVTRDAFSTEMQANRKKGQGLVKSLEFNSRLIFIWSIDVGVARTNTLKYPEQEASRY